MIKVFVLKDFTFTFCNKCAYSSLCADAFSITLTLILMGGNCKMKLITLLGHITQARPEIKAESPKNYGNRKKSPC